jgi:hypothetical protein
MFFVCIFLYIADYDGRCVTSRFVIYLGKCSNIDEFNYLPLTDEFKKNVRQTRWIVGL